MTDEPAETAQSAETTALEICPSCNSSFMRVADVDPSDPMGVAIALGHLQKCGTAKDIQDLLARDPAGHADLTWPGNVACLLIDLRKVGAYEQAAALLARDPARHVDISDPGSTAFLLETLRGEGAGEQAATLLARDPAGQCELDGEGSLAPLAWSLHNAGADDQLSVLLNRLSAAGMWSLLDEIHEFTGIPVPQQDQAGDRGGERHPRGE